MAKYVWYAQLYCAWLFEINLDIVWDTVQTALPELLKKLPTVCNDVDEQG